MGPTEEWLAVSRAGPAHGHLRDRRDAGDVVPGGDVARLIGRVDVVVGALDDMTRTEGVKRIWGRRHGRRPDGRVPRGLRRGRGGRGRGAPRRRPAIGASVGPGTTAGAGLDSLAGHVRGVGRRLGYHRGGARSAPRVRDLDHTPCHAAGLAIERVLVQDSHRSPDDIFELRTILGNNIVRILYFFDEGETIIAMNGFIKKQQKTPRSEILLAKQRRTIYLKRKGSRR